MSEAVQKMFSRISRRYDLANDVLSFGIHRVWRRKAVAIGAISKGQEVLDLCTGTGDLAFCLAKAVGKDGSVIGVDFVPEMLELARGKQGEAFPNVTFVESDALSLPFEDQKFDAATISFGIRNLDDTLAGLREIYRVLKPGGTLIVLEFGQPSLPIFSSLYTFYSKHIMPLVGSCLTGDRSAYEYLPETAKEYPCREEFTALMDQCDFSETSYRTLQFGIAYIYKGKRPALVSEGIPK